MSISKKCSQVIIYGFLIGNVIYTQSELKQLLEIIFSLMQGLSIDDVTLINTMYPIIVLLFTVALIYFENFILLWSSIDLHKKSCRHPSQFFSCTSLTINISCAIIFINEFAMLLQKTAQYLYALSSPIGNPDVNDFSILYLRIAVESVLKLLCVILIFLFNHRILKKVAMKNTKFLSKGEL